MLLLLVLFMNDALPALVDVVDRGKRLSVCTVNASGVVAESAEDLTAQAAAVVGRAVDLDAYSLARMVRSEEGRAGQIAKVYLCHVMLNQARALGWSVTGTIEFHTTPSRADHYGSQTSGRVASGADPYESDLAAAEYAQAQRAQGIDPTGGASNFVDQRAFGVQAGTGSFWELVDRWAAEGKRPGVLPDAPASLVFFWRGALPPQAEGLV